MQINETLISYSHRRFGNGGVYSKIGFSVERVTDPGYIYVKAGKFAGSRNQWQKHMLKNKLTIFDPNLSESANMELNGYHKAWDCGQIVFAMSKKN